MPSDRRLGREKRSSSGAKSESSSAACCCSELPSSSHLISTSDVLLTLGIVKESTLSDKKKVKTSFLTTNG